MKFMKIFLAVGCFFVIGGCVAANVDQGGVGDNKRLPVSYALSGTSTAVVGIAVDKNGIPKETVREIVLLPGQKVLFAGPDQFQIAFKDRKSPNKKIKYESRNGVIVIDIPKEILDRGEYVEEFKKYNYVKFNYSIFVNGKELDPPLIIRRDY